MFLSKGINVLGLFDGKSSGKTACDLAGIGINKYYSSEINKYANTVSNSMYPDIIRLGDITGWREWDIDWGSIDLILAGSPCQGFSFAGKQLALDDPRSKLFFEFINIRDHIQLVNKNVKWMLENVQMKKEVRETLDDYIGVKPVLINSALVSAQNRKRNYWASWNIPLPDDRHIYLSDILEEKGTGWIKNRGEYHSRNEKSMCICASYHNGVDNRGQRTMIKCGSMIGRRVNPDTGQREDYNKELPISQRIELRSDDKTGTLTTVQKDNLVIMQKSRGKNAAGVKALNGKTPTLSSSSWENNNHLTNGVSYRKLTPRECFRLQTVPEHLIDKILNCGVSNTQLYKIAGNGWTDEVIAHNLRHSGLCNANP